MNELRERIAAAVARASYEQTRAAAPGVTFREYGTRRELPPLEAWESLSDEVRERHLVRARPVADAVIEEVRPVFAAAAARAGVPGFGRDDAAVHEDGVARPAAFRRRDA